MQDERGGGGGEENAQQQLLEVSLLQEQRRRSFQSNALLSTKYPNLELRLRQERQLLFVHWKLLLSLSLFLNYFVLIVFRNLAYYRFNPKIKPLRDLGHELIPEMDENPFVETPMFIVFFLVIFCSIGAFVGHDRVKQSEGEEQLPPKPFFVNALKRTIVLFSTGHFLRALTYLSTNLPGPSKHCQTLEYLDPPPSLPACFYRLVSENGNCGDLNFSGHVYLLLLCTLYIHEYGRRFWNQPRFGWFHLSTTLLCLALGLVQIVLILGSRHHYSVDVVLAAYLSPLLWSFYWENSRDVEPDEGMIEAELARESTWPTWLRWAYFIASYFLLLVFVVSLAFSFAGNFRIGGQKHVKKGDAVMGFIFF